MHQASTSALNYLSIGGFNKSVVTNPDDIKWSQSYCTQHWEIYVQSLKFPELMITEADFGLRARISIEEKGIYVKQSAWQTIKDEFTSINHDLMCRDGDPRTRDFENMRSYCYYPGNCAGLGLKSVFITLPDLKELEITKIQYTLQRSNPYYCEIMIQALPDSYMEDQNEIDIIIGQPLLFNYYTIFSVQEGKIGFYPAWYT